MAAVALAERSAASDASGAVRPWGTVPLRPSCFLQSTCNTVPQQRWDLKKDLAWDIRELRQDLSSVGERVTTLEDSETSGGEEVEMIHWEVIRLEDQYEVLRALAEDLENRSCKNNIRLGRGLQ
ncbi:hypothetical protein NDU88_001392 [Pleurodeles waltl]|uniref:Uncharacterized protein n=1 Tax=Pleurodeles waltl TaxID=8319 RepID=A0AAV7P720_PLEWA|nr:hypothetical protein NDU88_001392 [Pleurodeles waltl]